MTKENKAAERNRICRQCLVYEEAGQVAEDIKKYLARLKEEDLVSDKVFSERIEICRDCDYLTGATCRACGCFIEFRANTKQGTCPKKKWK